MVCVICGGETSVTNSRHQKRNNQVWRRRKCSKCQVVFTTHEAANLSDLISVITNDGLSKPFDNDYLFADLLIALQDRPDRYTAAREVSTTTIGKLLKLQEKPRFKASQISHVAGGVLKRLDRRAWLRFVAEHPSLQ